MIQKVRKTLLGFLVLTLVCSDEHGVCRRNE